MYSSPFTGKTYNFDLFKRWNFGPPAESAEPPPSTSWSSHPFSHVFKYDVHYNLGHGSKIAHNNDVERSTISSPVESATAASSNSQSGHFAHKFIDINWSVNYDFNHGSTSAISSVTTEKADPQARADGNEPGDDDDFARKRRQHRSNLKHRLN